MQKEYDMGTLELFEQFGGEICEFCSDRTGCDVNSCGGEHCEVMSNEWLENDGDSYF